MSIASIRWLGSTTGQTSIGRHFLAGPEVLHFAQEYRIQDARIFDVFPRLPDPSPEPWDASIPAASIAAISSSRSTMISFLLEDGRSTRRMTLWRPPMIQPWNS
jgi:hypothetical protein